ncbi:MAG: T9SS type A sorting domain-containing protein [Candidatus Eisenbacteria bacterium]|nr:T9SS type A sorting domain-containing protein [Candidatus Latescibacterota bacterium]MBD3302317.1 T9SS type A sorting domain-containing protein [Candidatus Eisenbacteria bacterium]
MRSLPASGIGLVAFLLVVVPPASSTPPDIGEEFVLDHGFRYSYEVTEAMTATMAVSDSSVLFLWGEDGGYDIVGIETAPDGGPLGSDMAAPIMEGSHMDLSDPDEFGWKMVFGYGSFWQEPTRVAVRNLDPRTFETTGEAVLDPTGGTSVRNHEIARGDGFHVVCWLEGSGSRTLRLSRITPDLSLIDPEPIAVATGVVESALDLEMRSDGGILGYIDGTAQATVQLLGADGLPSGGPIHLGSAGTFVAPQIAVDATDEGWGVVWTGTSSMIQCAYLDAEGSPIAPGVFSIESAYHESGLDVACGADGVGLVTWRDGFGGFGIYATRIQEGVGRIGGRWTLDDDSPCWIESYQDVRSTACGWTGDRFAVCWVSYHGPPVGTEDPQDREARDYTGRRPVLAQWFDTEGEPLYDDPVPLSKHSDPRHTLVHPTSTGHMTITRDAERDQYFHLIQLDRDGRMSEEPSRYRTIAGWDNCDLDNCELHWISNLAYRRWNEDAGVVYLYTEYHRNEHFSHSNDSIVLDRVQSDGQLLSRTSTYASADEFQVGSYDAALGPDSSLVVFTVDEPGGNPSYGKVRLLENVTAHALREWELSGPEPVTNITTSALQDGTGRYLVVWLQGNSIRRATADPAQPGGLVGEPFATGFSAYGRPWLIDGSGQILLIFPASPGSGYDIFAQRYDAEGTPLDVEPFAVCELPYDQGSVNGYWDGSRYLVVYSGDANDRQVYGNRIDPDGGVHDGDGFVISPDFGGYAYVASDTAGHALVTYDWNRARRIDDSGPVVDVPEDPIGVGRIAQARITPNPTTGSCRLSASLPPGETATIRVYDATGREVARGGISAGSGKNPLVWNGRLPNGRNAPAGMYVVRIERSGEEIVRKLLLLH